MTYTQWNHSRWHAFAESGHAEEAKDQVLVVRDRVDGKSHRISFPVAAGLGTRQAVTNLVRDAWRKNMTPFDLESLFGTVQTFIGERKEQEAKSAGVPF